MGREGTAVLLRELSSGRWRIDLCTLPECRAKLGDDVLRAFACCFVHADRLVSLGSLFELSKSHHGAHSVAFRRNFETVLWFSVGTLRELSHALRSLRSALAKRGMLDASSPCWTRLREVESRWDRDPFFRNMRNQLAFHVAPEVIEAGLTRPGASGVVTLVEADSERYDDASMRLGIESLVMGTGLSLEEFGRFFDAASEDFGIASTIQSAFTAAASRAGISLEECVPDAR